METDTLTVTADDGLVDVVIDRGDDRNLMSLGMCRRLLEILREPPPEAHVLRLRAAGPVFCLGRERSADDASDLREEATTLADLNDALTASRLVTVVEVSGDAAGFGVGLAANADVAIASQDARFWFPEVRIDLAPAVVLSWLPRMVGRKAAFWLTATGSELTGDEARALGLLTATAPADELRATVEAAIDLLRGFEPRVHAGIKAYLGATEDVPRSVASALAVERLIIGSMSRRRDGEH